MSNPVVAEVVRNGFVESSHHGRLVVLDSAGSVVHAVGAVEEPMFPRSSLKPVQAAALLSAGWHPTDDAALALAAASHSGCPQHIDGVRRILTAAGVDEAALDNTPDLPLDAAAAAAWLRAGGGADRLHQNCSGKHAAMLATCVAAGWPLAGYRDPAHPLQAAIRRTVEELCGEPVAGVAVDGCGAPLFAASLTGLARGFAAAARTSVGRAMRAYPALVAGPGRDVTELMERCLGLVAKDGADGVYATSVDGVGAVAVKIDDGAARARVPVVLRGLELLGIDVGQLADLIPPVLGHGEPVGTVRYAGP